MGLIDWIWGQWPKKERYDTAILLWTIEEDMLHDDMMDLIGRLP